jgi:hypothetical protein
MRFGRFIPWLFYVYGRREFLELLVKQARSLEQHLGGTWSVKRGTQTRAGERTSRSQIDGVGELDSDLMVPGI